MRSLIAALPLLALTACGGASGPESIGSNAAPASGSSGGTGGGIGTPTPSPSPTPTPTPTHFLTVTAETSFDAVGSFHSLEVAETGVAGTTGAVLYQGNASTVRTPSGTVSYSPRDGIFTISFADTKAGVQQSARFQDPAHRTEVGGWGVPDRLTGPMTDFNFLESVGPTARSPSATDPTDLGRRDTITFFYQRPGSKTLYVSLAGYVRNAFEPTSDPLVFKADSDSLFQRGAMVFGQPTVRSQIPLSGTADYSGGLLATMVVNTSPGATNPTYFQWITGTADLRLDFGSSTMTMALSGVTSAATYAGVTLSDSVTGVPGGSQFTAAGSGTIDLTQTGGFTGRFTSASFTSTNGSTVPIYDSVNSATSIAGANSIDGTFFGPNAVNVGGNFRIVGGVPDQRVDILGAFTGAKK